ncbi:MAG: LytTR family transcriptional regulator [Clostridia bacterium]|nr:LytTR family transcriptional regulator [Clostridia bacterium]
MKIKIEKIEDKKLNKDEIEILIKSPILDESVEKLALYISQYEKNNDSKVLVNCNNTIKEISYDDIICFYSDKKYNYCKIKDKDYKIKSKLYEVENLSSNFIRISKGCIANYKHIKCFDISETGKIVVVFDDNSKEYVSRRKVKSIMNFLDERSV